MTQHTASPAVRRELLRTNLRAVVDDMSVALAHNSPADPVGEVRDYAVAFTTAAGEVVIADNPVQVPSLAMTARAILEYYEFNLRPGDLIVTNDPYAGGAHTQDLTVFAPVYVAEELAGALLVRVHIPDFGGQVVGGYNPPALEIWAEGIRLSPVKLARFGRIEKDVHHALLLNSRLPEQTGGLLDAMLATLSLGQDRVRHLVARFGFASVVEGLDYALQYSEAATRAVVRRWPAGVFLGQATLGHDCTDRSPVVRCRLEVAAGELTIDLSDSDPQSPSFMNSAWGATCGSALLPVISALGGDIPINSGLLRAVHFAGKEGSLVRPAYPAAVGWGQVHPGSEIINAVSTALSACTGQDFPQMPAQVLVHCCFAHYRTLSVDALVHAGAAAVNGVDGWGPPGYVARRRLASVEKTEIAFPEVLIEWLEMVPDAVMPGTWHGAPACEVVVTLRAPTALTACVGSPAAAAGHTPGRPRLSVANGETPMPVDTFCANRRLAGGVLRLRTAAGFSSGEGGGRYD